MIQERWYQGTGGRRLHHLQSTVDDPIGGVLVVHGYGEHSGRYAEVMEALAKRRLISVAPDLRGHGRSARMPGDLESLDTALGDLGRQGDHLERLAPGRPIFLLGHSMGALLCLILADREPRWAGAVLNGTPLAAPDAVSPLKRTLARVLGDVLPWVGLQSFYDPTRASRDPDIAMRNNTDPLQYKGRIQARTGNEILKAIAAANEAAPRIRIPVLVTHGGADRTVAPRASAQLHTALGSADKELQVFEGLLHKIHQEPEREGAIARWTIWLARHARALG